MKYQTYPSYMLNGLLPVATPEDVARTRQETGSREMGESDFVRRLNPTYLLRSSQTKEGSD